MHNFSPINQLIKKHYSLGLKKSLGQHFLNDSFIVDKIIDAAQINHNDIILEIGPGPGILTRAILEKKPKKLITIDADPRSALCLKELEDFYKEKLVTLTKDALKCDIKSLGDLVNDNSSNGRSQPFKIKIIANLPYNISTVLLCNWLDNIKFVDSMVLMFQQEVGLRIIATPGSKKYGRLSINTQSLCDVDCITAVSADSFSPPPKVESIVLKFAPNQNLIEQNLPIISILQKTVSHAFANRRKKIKSNLIKIFNNIDDMELALNNAGIDINQRAEDIAVSKFIKLAKQVKLNNLNAKH